MVIHLSIIFVDHSSDRETEICAKSVNDHGTSNIAGAKEGHQNVRVELKDRFSLAHEKRV